MHSAGFPKPPLGFFDIFNQEPKVTYARCG